MRRQRGSNETSKVAEDAGREGTGPSAPADVRLTHPGAHEERGRAQAGEILAAWQRGDWAPGGRYAKEEGASYTFLGSLRTATGVRAVAVKQVSSGRGLRGWLRAMAPRRRGWRQWRGAARLAAIGTPTAQPLLLARGRAGAEHCEWLALELVEGRTALATLRAGDLSVGEEHALAAQLGSLVRAIDEAGWFNRDSKLSNVIVRPDGGLVVVDTVGVQRRGGKRLRMLGAMLNEAMDAGVLPRRAVLMRALRAAADDPKVSWRAMEQAAAGRRG